MSKYRGIIKTVLIVFIIRTVLSIAVNGFSIENIAYDFLICLLILFFAILFFKLGYKYAEIDLSDKYYLFGFKNGYNMGKMQQMEEDYATFSNQNPQDRHEDDSDNIIFVEADVE